jgi:hypothetical protein
MTIPAHHLTSMPHHNYADKSVIRFYYLFPAFFELMLQLENDNRRFVVVFRTFGQDLRTVREEFK